MRALGYTGFTKPVIVGDSLQRTLEEQQIYELLRQEFAECSTIMSFQLAGQTAGRPMCRIELVRCEDPIFLPEYRSPRKWKRISREKWMNILRTAQLRSLSASMVITRCWLRKSTEVNARLLTSSFRTRPL